MNETKLGKTVTDTPPVRLLAPFPKEMEYDALVWGIHW
jgi:hypothetical protein